MRRIKDGLVTQPGNTAIPVSVGRTMNGLCLVEDRNLDEATGHKFSVSIGRCENMATIAHDNSWWLTQRTGWADLISTLKVQTHSGIQIQHDFSLSNEYLAERVSMI